MVVRNWSHLMISFEVKELFTESHAPYTSEQNGLVEWKHRHIVECGLTLLAQGSLPMKFWQDAYGTAVYLINRLKT